MMIDKEMIMKKISDEFHNELWVGMNEALSRTENYHSDGAVNWSYVDADVYMHLAKLYDVRSSNSLNDKYVTLFEKACDIIEEGIAVCKPSKVKEV